MRKIHLCCHINQCLPTYMIFFIGIIWVFRTTRKLICCFCKEHPLRDIPSILELMALSNLGVSSYCCVSLLIIFFRMMVVLYFLVDNQDFRLQQYAEAFRLFGAESIGRAWGAKGRNSPFFYMCNGTVMRFPMCSFCEVRG